MNICFHDHEIKLDHIYVDKINTVGEPAQWNENFPSEKIVYDAWKVKSPFKFIKKQKNL